MVNDRKSIKNIATQPTEKQRAEAVRRQKRTKELLLNKRRRESMINQLSRAFKRVNIPRNFFNLGTVTSMNNRYLSVRLSRKLIGNLQQIYKKTLDERVEYAGSIPFTVNNIRNYARFGTPTAHTNQKLGGVTFTQEDVTQYITYHSHPAPKDMGPIFTYPSGPDLKLYINTYPSVQANIILEKQGYYIIDLIETNMNKPNAGEVIETFESLIRSKEFERVAVTWSSIPFFQTTSPIWKRTINKYIDPIMRKQFGISIKYYTWSELGEITLLDKNNIMNFS
tara:strand:+ start:80 stop:922 length:843 start_codon:yes stop_codon:yes gene_type:complete